MSRLFLVLAVLIACVILGWSTRTYLGARAEADTATTFHTSISTQAQRLDQLRNSAPTESRRLPPPPGLASLIAATVSTAGLAHSSLQTVTPEVETPAAGGAFRKTAARVTLDQITLPELGRWLDEWRKAEPAWVVSSIDLSPTAAHRKGPQRTLRAGLSIEYIFAAAPKDTADANP